MWPVTEMVWSVTLVALFNTDSEPKTNSTSNTPRFTCLCCTLENLHWLSQGPNPLIACYSDYLHVISIRLHETMNYHLPDVNKKNRLHCIFLVLLKLLSLVLLKRNVHHSIGWIINNLRRGFRTLGSERLICWDVSLL